MRSSLRRSGRLGIGFACTANVKIARHRHAIRRCPVGELDHVSIIVVRHRLLR